MRAKKKFGQNFLIDNNIIIKISNCINASANDLIIEIGPGMGALTKILQKKDCNIICYEIDEDLKIYLDKLSNDKTKIIYKDILDTDIINDIKNIKYNKLFIVGNLPYYITTPIIKHIISLNLDIDEMIFMVQNEVADRYSASPKSKEYVSITLFLKYYFNIEKLFKVSKNSFNPVPKVESAIIKLNKRIDKPNINKDKYFKLIEDSFKMKRKTLKNNLSNYDFNKIQKVLDDNNLPPNIRAEELDEKTFINISNEIS